MWRGHGCRACYDGDLFPGVNLWMPLLRLVRRFGILLPGVAALALLCGILGFRVTEGMGLAELSATGNHRLALYAASLEREMDKYAYFPATVGLERDVVRLLSDGDGGDFLGHAVNLYLEQLNGRAGTLAIYVMNMDGRVVAASNWRRHDSYVGEDLSYRPYFTEAQAGRAGRFFGIGTTRGEPGYYLSAPLMTGGQQVGVAVVKVSLEQLEQSWSTVEAPVLVADENGVVILASVPSWKFTPRRRRKVQDSPSSETCQDSARQGSTWRESSFTRARPSNIWLVARADSESLLRAGSRVTESPPRSKTSVPWPACAGRADWPEAASTRARPRARRAPLSRASMRAPARFIASPPWRSGPRRSGG